MQLRTIIGTVLFFFLLARGIYYVNQPNQPRRKEYTDGWNLLMGQVNQIQQFVFGEIKVNTQQYSLTVTVMQQAFVRNMGVVYIASAGAALSKSSLLRLTALFGLLSLSFIYGRAKTSGLTNEDLLEKFQHLLIGVIIGLFIMTEPRTYDESKMEKILKGSLENYKQVMESKQRHSQKVEDNAHTESKRTQDSSKLGKAEKNSKTQKNKDEVEREERARQQQQDEADQKRREQEEEEERMKQEEDEKIRKEEEERIRQEEEEEEEQKRKFKVDDDGFSIMPKKSAKKVQAQRSNAAKQKKEQYDI